MRGPLFKTLNFLSKSGSTRRNRHLKDDNNDVYFLICGELAQVKRFLRKGQMRNDNQKSEDVHNNLDNSGSASGIAMIIGNVIRKAQAC